MSVRGRALLAALALCASGAAAQERIVAHDVDIRVLEDGRLDVVARIEVRAEGRAVRRGIVHDVQPQGADGRIGRGDVEVLQVLRDGVDEPWTSARIPGGRRLVIGGDRHLAIPSQPVYTLHYRIDRQLRFLGTHDALRFDAIAPGGTLPVERARVSVALPAPVAPAAMRAGVADDTAAGAGRALHVARSARGTTRWTTTRPLAPDAGLTVTLAFPAGLVTPPGPRQRLAWWLRDHLGPLVAGGGLLLLAGFCALRRRRIAHVAGIRDVPARADPPPGVSPAGLRYVRDTHHDARGFAADLLAAAVAEHLRFQREPGAGRTGWRVLRTREGGHALPTMEQRAQLSTLLPAAHDAITLDARGRDPLRRARHAHADALRRRFQPALVRSDGAGIAVALAIMLVTGGAAVVLARGGEGLFPTLGLLAVMPAVVFAFALRAKVPSAEGRRLRLHVEALRRHLAADAAAPAAPQIDARQYAALLPCAVALDVETAWTRRFVASVGADAAANAVAGFDWYRGVAVTDARRFARSIGNGLSAHLDAAWAGRTARRRRAHGGDPARGDTVER